VIPVYWIWFYCKTTPPDLDVAGFVAISAGSHHNFSFAQRGQLFRVGSSVCAASPSLSSIIIKICSVLLSSDRVFLLLLIIEAWQSTNSTPENMMRFHLGRISRKEKSFLSNSALPIMASPSQASGVGMELLFLF
jgi:hypothetical protein